MTEHPAALQLRLLQTVVEVAAEENSTLPLPFPVELLQFLERATPADITNTDIRTRADRPTPPRDTSRLTSHQRLTGRPPPVAARGCPLRVVHAFHPAPSVDPRGVEASTSCTAAVGFAFQAACQRDVPSSPYTPGHRTHPPTS
jgi:hypothetical protein